MKVAFATCSALPDGWHDDHPAGRLLGAVYHAWDDPTVDWSGFDRVVIRSAWDYTARVDEFLAWCSAVGTQRLRNPPELVAFNADKRYLAELEVPIVPTVFLAPADVPPMLDGEVVVKPNISAGACDTGRFRPLAHDRAHALIAAIHSTGRVALVQPYIAAVEHRGETALVFLAGELSHVVRKRAILAPDEIAPLAGGPLASAAAMLGDDLVTAGLPDPAECALADRVIAEVSSRFGTPLYARVDLVTGPRGSPALLELEVIEPELYLATSPGASQRMAAAVRNS